MENIITMQMEREITKIGGAVATLDIQAFQSDIIDSAVVFTVNEGDCTIIVRPGCVKVVTNEGEILDGKTSLGAVRYLKRTYGAKTEEGQSTKVADAKHVSVIDSNIDKIEKFLSFKQGTLVKDTFGEVDDTETVYITFTNVDRKVFVCVLKDGDKAEYGVHIADMEDILEAKDKDEDYEFNYKWYKHSGRLINQLRDACL